MTVGFNQWLETDRLFQIRREFRHNEVRKKKMLAARVLYKAKIKLHGSNTGIRIEKDDVGFQGRRRNIGSLKTGDLEEYFDFQSFGRTFNCENVRTSDFKVVIKKDDKSQKTTLQEVIATGGAVTIYGEWVGPGIQKLKDEKGNELLACAKVAKRFFAIFAIRVEDKDGKPISTELEPFIIERIIGNQPDNVYILPWFVSDLRTATKIPHPDGDIWSILMDRDKEYQQAYDDINAEIAKIEKCDPYIKTTFGIEGIGEGLVFYPEIVHYKTEQGENIAKPMVNEFAETYIFKVKGDDHMLNLKQKQPKDLTRHNEIDAWISEHAKPLWDSLWDENEYKDPQDIPKWQATAGRAVKEHFTKVFADSGIDNPKKYDWNSVKGRVGVLTVNYLKDALGF